MVKVELVEVHAHNQIAQSFRLKAGQMRINQVTANIQHQEWTGSTTGTFWCECQTFNNTVKSRGMLFWKMVIYFH